MILFLVPVLIWPDLSAGIGFHWIVLGLEDLCSCTELMVIDLTVLRSNWIQSTLPVL